MNRQSIFSSLYLTSFSGYLVLIKCLDLCCCPFCNLIASNALSLTCLSLSHKYYLKGLAIKCNSESLSSPEFGFGEFFKVVVLSLTLILHPRSVVFHVLKIHSLSLNPNKSYVLCHCSSCYELVSITSAVIRPLLCCPNDHRGLWWDKFLNPSW